MSMGRPGWNVTWVDVVGVRMVRTSLATWAAVRPTPIALSGSTVTWISGVALTRSLFRLAIPVVFDSAATTDSVVDATSVGSGELTMMLRPFELKPAASETWTS